MYQRRKIIGNDISDRLFCYNKMENYKEQYTNKKEDKELKLKCLRTVVHGGNF